jgi:HEAT repeat protein
MVAPAEGARPAQPQSSAVQRTSLEQPVPLEVPATARLLRPFPQWSEQEAAAEALGRIGAAAVPPLIVALRSEDPTVRLRAAEVLGRMGPEAADAVEELVRLLNDPDVRVRKAAIRTLGQIGPAAKDAVPALIERLLMPADDS